MEHPALFLKHFFTPTIADWIYVESTRECSNSSKTRTRSFRERQAGAEINFRGLQSSLRIGLIDLEQNSVRNLSGRILRFEQFPDAPSDIEKEKTHSEKGQCDQPEKGGGS